MSITINFKFNKSISKLRHELYLFTDSKLFITRYNVTDCFFFSCIGIRCHCDCFVLLLMNGILYQIYMSVCERKAFIEVEEYHEKNHSFGYKYICNQFNKKNYWDL